MGDEQSLTTTEKQFGVGQGQVFLYKSNVLLPYSKILNKVVNACQVQRLAFWHGALVKNEESYIFLSR